MLSLGKNGRIYLDWRESVPEVPRRICRQEPPLEHSIFLKIRYLYNIYLFRYTRVTVR